MHRTHAGGLPLQEARLDGRTPETRFAQSPRHAGTRHVQPCQAAFPACQRAPPCGMRPVRGRLALRNSFITLFYQVRMLIHQTPSIFVGTERASREKGLTRALRPCIKLPVVNIHRESSSRPKRASPFPLRAAGESATASPGHTPSRASLEVPQPAFPKASGAPHPLGATASPLFLHVRMRIRRNTDTCRNCAALHSTGARRPHGAGVFLRGRLRTLHGVAGSGHHMRACIARRRFPSSPAKTKRETSIGLCRERRPPCKNRA